jgi:hypothetical protein
MLPFGKLIPVTGNNSLEIVSSPWHNCHDRKMKLILVRSNMIEFQICKAYN